MRLFRHPWWQHLDYRVKVATTQENKPPTQGTRQWTFTTPRWRCGSILLPSLNAGVPEPTGGHHWFRLWLVAWSAPSHYLKQCWIIVNWTLRNKLQWNFNQNSNILIQENVFESIVCKMASILSQLQCAEIYLLSSKARTLVQYGPKSHDNDMWSIPNTVSWFWYTGQHCVSSLF